MALQSSGSISLANIQTEFGGSHPISLSEYYGASSGIPGSGQIAISQFYGASSSLDVNVSFTQCYDHYANVYYDGNGNISIRSHEPSGSIHTGRGDCGGHQQGNYTRYSFTKSSWTTLNVVVSASGRNGSGSKTINQSVNSTYGPIQVGATDGSGGAAGYSFTIIGTLSQENNL